MKGPPQTPSAQAGMGTERAAKSMVTHSSIILTDCCLPSKETRNVAAKSPPPAHWTPSLAMQAWEELCLWEIVS